MIDLSPRALIARIPFVVLVICALAVGLGITLWLSTDAAQRSYQLGNARSLTAALSQQKEALERDVLEAQSAPALAEHATPDHEPSSHPDLRALVRRRARGRHAGPIAPVTSTRTRGKVRP